MAFLAGPIRPGVERVVRFDYAGVHRARTPSRSGRPVLDTSAGVCAGPAVGCTGVPKRWGGQRDRRAVDRPGSFRGVPADVDGHGAVRLDHLHEDSCGRICSAACGLVAGGELRPPVGDHRLDGSTDLVNERAGRRSTIPGLFRVPRRVHSPIHHRSWLEERPGADVAFLTPATQLAPVRTTSLPVAVPASISAWACCISSRR